MTFYHNVYARLSRHSPFMIKNYLAARDGSDGG